MQQVPADTQQATPHPVPLDNEPGCRSISDDNLCVPDAAIFTIDPVSAACAD